MYRKYKNTKVYSSDGKKFDSKKELNRYNELRLLESAGEITGLCTQVSFLLVPTQKEKGFKTELPVKYIADFVYEKDGEMVVEDVKGFKTPEYVIKRKLMLYLKGIRVTEV